jgi:hypothetical protein
VDSVEQAPLGGGLGRGEGTHQQVVAPRCHRRPETTTGASGTRNADAARACACVTRKRQQPTSKPTPPTTTPTTAETRHQTRDTKKQRQQRPDGSNKTAKRGRGGGTSMGRWLQMTTPKETKQIKKKSKADDHDNSRQ